MQETFNSIASSLEDIVSNIIDDEEPAHSEIYQQSMAVAALIAELSSYALVLTKSVNNPRLSRVIADRSRSLCYVIANELTELSTLSVSEKVAGPVDESGVEVETL
jgi:hypothetical protein